MMNIGFLSTIDFPLLPLFLKEAVSAGVKNIHVIFDSKMRSEKDQRIWRERTVGAFDLPGDNNPTLYAFSHAGISFYFVENHNGDDALALYQALNIDCLINAGTPRKLSSSLLEAMRHGVVNIHPGLLPAYRGCSSVEWALYNDDPVGNTVHFMSEGYDTGPVIASESYEFPKNADYPSIRTRVYREGCRMAGRVLASIQRSGMTPADATLQDEKLARYWNPIPEEKMVKVLGKVSAGGYRYQVT